MISQASPVAFIAQLGLTNFSLAKKLLEIPKIFFFF